MALHPLLNKMTKVQDHESKLFLSYFKGGIRYLEGGVESGFRKVERGKYEKRLLQVKGKRNVRVRQVECECSSLNQGDVFILDDGQTIYVWTGPNSSRLERVKGAEVARRIRDEERSGKAIIKIIDETWDTDDKFFQALGTKEPVKDAAAGGDDSEYERIERESVKLFRVSDASGELEITKIDEKPLKKEHLDSNDCFILDSGPSGIFVWTGKKCTTNERKSSWKNALEFLSFRGYPNWTKVTKVVEEGETPLFKQYFQSWKNEDEVNTVEYGKTIDSYEEKKEEHFDANLLHEKAQQKEMKLPDDGSGRSKIWRIENREMMAVPEEMYGTFYSGDCYIIQYTYMVKNREDYIIYFWQGARSTIDERTASALQAQNLDDDALSGKAVQVRVIQGKEPEHFLRLFMGRMIIFLGGMNNPEAEENPDAKLFHIKGSNGVNTRTIQVQAKASNLNSNDVFLLQSEDHLFMWCGKGSSENEREVSTKAVFQICPDRDPTVLEEGEEDEAFWDLLGGKDAYTTTHRLESDDKYVQPRLFQCSNKSGRFAVDEVLDFSQEDLDEDDVMILDTYDEVFVWIGEGANEVERKESLRTAMEYIRTDPSGRSQENTLIVQVKQGCEPLYFTGYFHAWDPARQDNATRYENMKETVKRENDAVHFATENAEVEYEAENAGTTVIEFENGPDEENVSEQKTFEETSFMEDQNVSAGKNNTEEENVEDTSIVEDEKVFVGQNAATYDDIKEAVKKENAAVTLVEDELAKYDATYSVQELRRRPPPTGVDPTRKEDFLSDDDFKEVFGITREKYKALQKWKQVDLKKKALLF